MNSSTLYTINDPYKPYRLSAHLYLSEDEDSCSMPSVDASTQGRLYRPQDSPKLPILDSFIRWLPTWAYCIILGFVCLIGLTLTIVFFGFALHFIIVHGSSLP